MGNARRIAIVGAGLGGLAAAIALRRQGFEVQVYEQAAELAEFGAGINISPNSVKFFHAVGLADKLHAISSEPIGLIWRVVDAGPYPRMEAGMNIVRPTPDLRSAHAQAHAR